MARIEILSIRVEDVRQKPAANVMAEGFKFWIDFIQVWQKMHDEDCPLIPVNTIADVRRHIARRPAENYQAAALTFKLLKD